ncbi:hypothetical protein EDC01DRAFT_631792 [Geopyxis carbonaria]|nr:hypothetical protein EDC01DRAFT_631792 [Geopyxis carbonaria]
MTSTIPVHQYHPPRHPHAFTPTSNPNYTTSTSYYTSSSTSTQQSSYWSNGPPSSVSTTSSTQSPRINPGLAAAQFVTKHTAARLHKRSRSGNNTPDEIPDELFDEGFFSGPGSPPTVDTLYQIKPTKTKGKIKPLLMKVSGSRSNSLDLSRSDGGLNGVGLGIYDTQGYDSSGIDEEMLETAFPKSARRRHVRNVSNNSGSSPLLISGPAATPVQPFAHPKRQLPRRGVYTPNESSDGEDVEEEDEAETRRIVLSGSIPSGPRGGLSLDTGRTTPMLPPSTTSMTDLHSYTRGRAPSSEFTSPISPISPVESLPPSLPASDITTGKKIKSRGRIASSQKSSSIREPSPSFTASVTAARLAWEAKEEKKEEKREKKRRRSEAKGEERTASRTSNRGRGNSGSTAQSVGTVWNADDLDADSGFQEKQAERDEDEVYTGRRYQRPRETKENRGRGRNATGKKWGVLGAERGRKKKNGAKKRWLGFFVWVRIGMVRLGRKMGF